MMDPVKRVVLKRFWGAKNTEVMMFRFYKYDLLRRTLKMANMIVGNNS